MAKKKEIEVEFSSLSISDQTDMLEQGVVQLKSTMESLFNKIKPIQGEVAKVKPIQEEYASSNLATRIAKLTAEVIYLNNTVGANYEAIDL